MQFNEARTVREIALEIPGATRIFEKMGIDYCCGGEKPIAEACRTAGVTVAEVARSIELYETSSQESAGSANWQTESLASLITHIEGKHHRFAREEFDSIEPLLAKVCSVYGEKRPELFQIQTLFGELKSELLLHMKKEENILFPYIVEIEAAATAGSPAPVAMFGTVRNPVRMMMIEHDGAGEVLRKIRQLSNDFSPPVEACVSYQTLYGRFEGLEQDLHLHIHLENNILFPRTIEMEG